jgi:geranylgeranyl reductase family protein
VRTFDVIVVGMGPGGAVAAAELGRAGLSVLGLEWRALPRYKVCGGGLSARIDRVLEPDYRRVVEKTIHTVQFQIAGAEPFQVASSEPIAYMVMRDRFDAHLVRKAREAGACVQEEERAVTVSAIPEGVEVVTGQGRYRGKVVVGADGAMSLVARSLFPGSRGRLMSGLEAEVAGGQRMSLMETGTIVLDTGVLRGGYAWVFPKERGLSVGVAEFQGRERSAKSGYDRFVEREPTLAGLAGAKRRGHPIPLYGGTRSERTRLATDRALLVGDAAHLVDPLFGEGIYYAALSGRMAARSIVDFLRGATGDLHAYEEQIARDIYPEFRIASRIAWVLYTFPRVSHRLIRSRPDIIHFFYDVLKGRESYQTFYAKVGGEAKISFPTLLRHAFTAAFSG